MDNLMNALDREALALVRALSEERTVQRLIDGTITRGEYIGFLTQSYYYVSHTSPLLRRAGERLEGSLSDLLKRKAAEERGHERWILSDLKALGRGVKPAGLSPPSAAVSAYIAWNRFTCEEGPPAAILGTAYMLERLAAARAGRTADKLVAVNAISGVERAVRFLRRHAEADVRHIEQLASALSSLRRDGNEALAILLSAQVTRALYPAFFSGAAIASPREGGASSPSSPSIAPASRG